MTDLAAIAQGLSAALYLAVGVGVLAGIVVVWRDLIGTARGTQ